MPPIAQATPEPGTTIPFSGFLFSFTGTGALELPPDGRRAPRAVAGRCRVALEIGAEVQTPETLSRRTLQWRWSGPRAEVQAHRIRAQLNWISPGEYAARAVATHGAETETLLTALSAAALEREGGLVVHATAIDFGGRAVLFIGPSGTGKTTAASLCRTARRLARDRAALVHSDGRWHAWTLPGGTPDTLLPDARDVHCLPLAAILRVRHGSGEARISDLTASDATAVLRESVFAPNASVEAELRTLDVASSLATTMPVATLHSVLGQPLDSLLETWLRRRLG